MWPDRVSNPEPLALESDALPTVLFQIDRIQLKYLFQIHRIQNKALYQQYVAKKELMTKQTPNPPAQFPIERTVWHGTSPAAAPSIQMHGFNRSYAGDKNGDYSLLHI